MGVASLAWSIDSLKLDGVDKGKVVQGVITKIEGNKITIKDTSGKLLTIGVRPESTDQDHKVGTSILRGLKVGDKVKIQGGNLTKITGPVKSDIKDVKTEHK